MSSNARNSGAPHACLRCLRRSWLLSALSGPLEYRSRDRGRLLDLLALEDGDLIQAVGGKRRAELSARYEAWHAGELVSGPGVEALCHHHDGYPRALSGPAAPRMLNVAGGVARFAELTAAPVVAILGSRTASDYGMEMARSLAQGLAACGVTVTSGLVDGIVAAHVGGLQGQGGTLAVVGGGLDASPAAWRRSLYERVTRAGCAVSELPCDCRGRRWGALASERTVVELAELAVVVEAEDTQGDLAAARLAAELGRLVAAIPGRVTSPLSSGPHALLMDGARLVRGAQDTLELLYPLSGLPTRPPTALGPHPELEPRLRAILERVGAGGDTPDKLTPRGADAGEVLLALSELELMGLLARGDGGRYAPRYPLPAAQRRPGGGSG